VVRRVVVVVVVVLMWVVGMRCGCRATRAPPKRRRRRPVAREQLRARVSVAAATQTSLRVRGESLPSELVASPSELLASHSELTGAGGAGVSLGLSRGESEAGGGGERRAHAGET
jgi:hypothetical protein